MGVPQRYGSVPSMVERAEAGILQFVPGRPRGSNCKIRKLIVYSPLCLHDPHPIGAKGGFGSDDSGTKDVTKAGAMGDWFAPGRVAVLHIMHA